MILGDSISMAKEALLHDVLYDFTFNDMFMIDSNRQRQALYYSPDHLNGSETFPHGPPSPTGGKFSLQLESNSHIRIPSVQQQETMTIKFWMFLTQPSPDDSWKSLLYMQEESTGNANLEVQLWPSENRLQVRILTSNVIETLDTVANLLPRKWYHIAITTISSKNEALIYINGYLDSSSRVLRGDHQTARQNTSYYFGSHETTRGVYAYIDHIQIFSRQLENAELLPAYSFMQSTKDLFIIHACQSCTYEETELV